MYIIKNKTYNTYFKKSYLGFKHFVIDKEEAKKFETKEAAEEVMKTFKHKKNFKLIEEIKVVQVNGN
jgi:hypothetical protein